MLVELNLPHQSCCHWPKRKCHHSKLLNFHPCRRRHAALFQWWVSMINLEFPSSYRTDVSSKWLHQDPRIDASTQISRRFLAVHQHSWFSMIAVFYWWALWDRDFPSMSCFRNLWRASNIDHSAVLIHRISFRAKLPMVNWPKRDRRATNRSERLRNMSQVNRQSINWHAYLACFSRRW